MIKGVIFDLDDTLYDYENIHPIAMKNLMQYVCTKLAIEESEFTNAFTKAKMDTKEGMLVCASQHNRMIYCQKTLENLGVNPISCALEMYDVYWNCMLKHMELNPGVIDLFEMMKSEGICIAICTDLTTHIQHRKIRELGIEKYIDVLVTSEEAGAEKPDPKMFDLCLKKMNMMANEVAYIGDSIKKDIVGALGRNINAIWYNPNKQVAPSDLEGYTEVQSFFELLNKEKLYAN